MPAARTAPTFLAPVDRRRRSTRRNTNRAPSGSAEDITEPAAARPTKVARLLREQAGDPRHGFHRASSPSRTAASRANGTRRYEEDATGTARAEMDGQPPRASYIRTPRPARPRAVDVYDALGAWSSLRSAHRASPPQGRQHRSGIGADGRAVDFQPTAQRVPVDRGRRHRGEEAPPRSCSACSPSSRRSSITWWSASPVHAAIARPLRCNCRYEELFGYVLGTAVARTPTRDVYFTEQEDPAVAAERPPSSTRARRTRARHGCAAGRLGLLCRISGTRGAAGRSRRKGDVWLLEDITERRRADEALERGVRGRDAAATSAPIGIIFAKDRKILAPQPALRGNLRLRRRPAGRSDPRASCSRTMRPLRPAAKCCTRRSGMARRSNREARAR